MAASVSSSLSTGSIPLAAARTAGCSPARSAAGTPTSSPMTAMGSGSAKSAMNSTSPFSARSSSRPSTSVCTAGRSRSTWRGVNERDTSRRSRVWSGGSASSMLCWDSSRNSSLLVPAPPKMPVEVSSIPMPRPSRGSRSTDWHSS